ncbi:MAG: VWA domain-containing protein [Acidobacteria bacterium]|nr:VWA domain-containing protein [Acidobacteriota bacterium]
MHRTTRRLVLTGSLCLLAATASGESGQVRFRVTVEEVLVDVVVTERNRPLAGLTAADFVLLDGGVRRDIRLVPLEDLPVSVLFVMDLSESVTRDRRQRLAAAARQFSGQLSENDRCAVMIFSSQPVLTHDFAGCSELPPNPFPEEGVIGGTALWDSLLLSTALAGEEPGRAVVIVFTDGDDTMSWTPEGFVEAALQGSEAVLYTVIPPDARGTTRRRYRYRNNDYVPPSVARRRRIGIRRMNGGIAPDELAVLLEGPRRTIRPRAGMRAPSELQLLRHVTELSGGRLVQSRDEERLLAAYGEILDEMRARYLLAFVPDPAEPAGWRSLEVTVNRDGASVRARSGYLHQPGGGADPGPGAR